MTPPNFPYPFFSNGDLANIALGLTATFTAGCIGFALISLILRDYDKQPPPFLRHKPLLIASYVLAAIGGVSLVYSLGLVLLVGVIGIIPALVFGGCIGLAAVSFVFRDALPSLRNKPLRIILYVLVTASFSWSVFLLGVGYLLILFFSLYALAFMLILLPVIAGSAGFAAATILLRGNMERNLSIAGIIIGVCLVITLGGMLATQLGIPYLGFL
jgi:hypothetical protein